MSVVSAIAASRSVRTINWARRIPFSLAFAILLIATSIISGTVHRHATAATRNMWAAGVTTTFDSHAWWTAITALVVPWDPFQLVFNIAAAVFLLGAAERLQGTRRTVIAFTITGIVGVVLGTCIQWVGSLYGEWWATGTSRDLTLDPLTGVVGALTAASAFMGPLWRRRTRLLTLATLLVFVLYAGDSSNVYRLIAWISGFWLGQWFARRRQSVTTINLSRSSHQETRTLVAAIVVVTAIGPVVSLLSRSRITPFAFGSFLYQDAALQFRHVFNLCHGALRNISCQRDVTILSHQGLGLLVLSFLPVVLLLLAAWGIRNGRRFAAGLAICVDLAILFFNRGTLDVSHTHDIDVWTTWDVGELIVWVAASAILPMAVILLLLITRRRYSVTASRSALIRFWVVIGIAGAVLFTSYFLIGLATIDAFWPHTSAGELFWVEAISRFIPPHFLPVVKPVVLPGHIPTLIAYRWVGVVFWAVFVGAAIWLLSARRARAQRAEEYEPIRSLIRKHGGGTFGFMGTWEGNSHWYSADKDAAVAYRVVNDIAIAVSDPLCTPERLAETISGFVEFCDLRSWTPVFYSVHQNTIATFMDMGWQHMSVGEETIVHTTGLELTGKSWQKVRYALNRGIKEGMTTVWSSWADLPHNQAAEIMKVSEAWVAEKKLPEMGFTLGGLNELRDPEVKLMLAFDAAGALQAITSWLPIYRDGQIVGRTLDFMRRVDGSMNGTMEFLIASVALHLRDAGIDILSLSGAPLVTAPLGPDEEPRSATAMSRLLEWLSRVLEPAYGFASLFKFKERFNPEYSTIYMAYPEPLVLPSVGVALGRAYLPEISPREALALVRTLTKGYA